MSNKPLPLIIGGTLGIIGALIAWDYAAVGVPILVLASLLVYFGTRKAPMHTMVIKQPEQEQKKMEDFLAEPAVDTQDLKKLKKALRDAQCDPFGALLLDNDDKPIYRVSDVLGEISTIASAYHIPFEQLAKDIAPIYHRLYENVPAAIEMANGDLDVLTVWLAKKSLGDVHPEIDKAPA